MADTHNSDRDATQPLSTKNESALEIQGHMIQPTGMESRVMQVKASQQDHDRLGEAEKTNADVHLKNYGVASRRSLEVDRKTPTPPTLARASKEASAMTEPMARPVQRVTTPPPTYSSGTTRSVYSGLSPPANRDGPGRREPSPPPTSARARDSSNRSRDRDEVDEAMGVDDTTTGSSRDAGQPSQDASGGISENEEKRETDENERVEDDAVANPCPEPAAHSSKWRLPTPSLPAFFGSGSRGAGNLPPVSEKRPSEHSNAMSEDPPNKLKKAAKTQQSDDQRRAEEAERLVIALRRQCDDLKTEKSRLDSTLSRWRRTESETVLRLRREAEKLRSDLHEQRRLEAAYNDRIRKLERRIEEQEGSVAGAQSAAKALMEQNRSVAASDSQVKGWFVAKQGVWYSWAKEFAHRDPERLAGDLPDSALRELGRIVVLEHGSTRLPLELQREKRAPYVLLQGLLVDFICAEIFAKPWWVFAALEMQVEGEEDVTMTDSGDVIDRREDLRQPEVRKKGVPASESMRTNVDALYETLINVNEKDAHQWRASLMRILVENGIGGLKKEGASDTTKRFSIGRMRLARGLARRFLSPEGTARLLLEDESPGMLQACGRHLEEEINEALYFAAQLWAHRSFLCVIDLATMQKWNQDTFRAASEGMQPHDSQKLDPPDAYHGLPVMVVVQPGIVACGTEEGDNYASSRVWMKATVWVGETAGRRAEWEKSQETERRREWEGGGRTGRRTDRKSENQAAYRFGYFD